MGWMARNTRVNHNCYRGIVPYSTARSFPAERGISVARPGSFTGWTTLWIRLRFCQRLADTGKPGRGYQSAVAKFVRVSAAVGSRNCGRGNGGRRVSRHVGTPFTRSEEHTSELESP